MQCQEDGLDAKVTFGDVLAQPHSAEARCRKAWRRLKMLLASLARRLSNLSPPACSSYQRTQCAEVYKGTLRACATTNDLAA